ncbi:NAD(P)H-dependent oxidoreductase subunit E [Haloimpatiens sp. FM7315]|uniref:NADH-quinone oxidoreductase subunit NuoE family protein n=1 Tax=Haloimpatiens sp. FM7315 TaxID=3298609 RepID=UPI00370AAC6A
MNRDEIRTIAERYNHSRQKIIFMLRDLQKMNGNNFIEEKQARLLSKEINVPISEIYEIITFYSMFNEKPKGKYIIEVCNSGPCFVRNSKVIINYVEELLGIKVGETTEDNFFTLQCTSCIGGCDVAPAMKIGDTLYGNLTKNKLKKILHDYRREALCQLQ